MNYLKKSLLLISPFLLLLTLTNSVFSADEDFVVDTKTEIQYTTGDDFVTVKTEYARTVKNSSYYFPATGEKIFHIPDISDITNEEMVAERVYKAGSIAVTDEKGTAVKYSIEEKENGEGIYVTVPNYKSTSSSSPYRIIFSYKTHDFVSKVGSFVTITGTSLPKETTFSKQDDENGTLTTFNYDLSIVTDGNVSPLAKAFPEYTKTESDGKIYYNFKQTDRIGNSPTLEFGTSVVYRFDLEYQTKKTDSLIPEKYTELLGALTTNIYEISLPREFSETNQKVYFENVSPRPKDVYRDSEGNILALFEVPSNQDSMITISGYIEVKQDVLDTEGSIDMAFTDYLEKIKGSEYIRMYLDSTKYWEVKDDFIKQEAENLMKDKITLMDIIKADYAYVNEKLEYDQDKANSENERIGAKNALQGGASVCMEYSDVMITLLRAQGIPARAAIGYANLRQKASTDQVRHQWVQVWVPDYGWLSVDPTFESSNMKIGQMMDRVLWDVFNEDSLSNIRIYSANDIKSLSSEGYTVSIYGAEDVDLSTLESYADLISKEEISDQNLWVSGNTILKTTTLGRALIVTVPILLVLALLIVLITTVKKILKKNKSYLKV